MTGSAGITQLILGDPRAGKSWEQQIALHRAVAEGYDVVLIDPKASTSELTRHCGTPTSATADPIEQRDDRAQRVQPQPVSRSIGIGKSNVVGRLLAAPVTAAAGSDHPA